jgi:hypothetical protein
MVGQAGKLFGVMIAASDHEGMNSFTMSLGAAPTLFDDYNKDSSLVEGMVTMCHEFGFNEPHRRWGPVAVEECINYATMVLEKVIIPMHKATQRNSTHQNNCNIMGYKGLWLLVVLHN